MQYIELFEHIKLPFVKQPNIGWVWNNDPIRLYHGTHKSKLEKILKHGLYAPTEGPTANWVSLALEPNTASGYASMHGGETAFRRAGGEAIHTPIEDRRILVIDLPKQYVLNNMDKKLRGNLQKDKLISKEKYLKWKEKDGSDSEYYALTELRFPKHIPSNFIVGWMGRK